MVAHLPKTDTKTVTDILEEWFIDHGDPVSIRTDGGPQFWEPFDIWCPKHHIRHELSSAYHHESNGHAECAVREMKKLLGKTASFTTFRRALRGYRNCPRYDGLSPAQWYYGRRQRTDAVALPVAFERVPDATIAKHEHKREEKIMKQQSCADRSSRQRAPMIPGQVIIAQHMLTKQWDQRATIIESRSNGRSYLVRMNNGRQYLRNRRFLPPSPVQKDPARSVDTSEVPCGTDAVPKPTVTTHRYPKRNRQRRMSLEPDEPQKRRQCF